MYQHNPTTGRLLLGRFAVDSLRGEWHRRILRDRAAATAEWHRNIRLAAMPEVEPSDDAIEAEYDFLAERKAWRGHIRLIDLLEGRYLRHRTEHLAAIDTMSREPHNEGRGQVINSRAGVNATEVRYSERWQSSVSGRGMRAARALGAFVAGVTGKACEDPTVCVSIRPDGSREAFVPATARSRRNRAERASVTIGAAGRYQHMLRLFGAADSGVDEVG